MNLTTWEPSALDDPGPIGLAVRWEVDPYALARLMAERAATPASLAAALACPRSTVTRWLDTGRPAAVTLATLQRVRDALNGSVVTRGHLVVTAWNTSDVDQVRVADLVAGTWAARR